MRNLHKPQESCEGCPFGGPKVGSKGNPEATIVAIAESPGREEVKEGSPLVGPSGGILHRYMPDNDEVYYLNAMECSPRKSLKNPTTLAQGARACHERLIGKIRAHPRRLIVAFGNPAVWSLTGNYGYKITQIRGRLIDSPFAELGIMPIVHPAALMKGAGNFRQFLLVQKLHS